MVETALTFKEPSKPGNILDVIHLRFLDLEALDLRFPTWKHRHQAHLYG